MKTFSHVAVLATAALFLAACEGDDGTDGAGGARGVGGNDGINSLVAFRDIPKGDADCLGGGLALDSGLDTNRNDILDAGEVTASELLECAATPQVRALHASPDTPAVNIWVNGAPALTNVDYAKGRTSCRASRKSTSRWKRLCRAKTSSSSTRIIRWTTAPTTRSSPLTRWPARSVRS